MGSDRAELRIELKNAGSDDVLAALKSFIQTQHVGRIGFEKDGGTFSMWATSEIEPT